MIAALLAIALLGAAADQKLLPGAEGKLCLGCHQDFEARLHKPFVHTPMKEGKCTDCHRAHASQHGKLLDQDASKICLGCHAAVIPAGAKSVHAPVAKGSCVACHDPHSSDDKFELLKPQAQLCASCHAGIADAAFRARFKHEPMNKGASCSTCHDAHASANGTALLRHDEPALCLSCHKPGKEMDRAHSGYPVATSRCSSCHDPHGSNRKGMLFDTVHKPVATRQCADCHAAAGSAAPLALKQEGVQLCQGCHKDKVALMTGKAQIHEAIVDGKGCLNCHAAHASKKPGLLRGTQIAVCGSCHADTIRRQEQSPTKHVPVQGGDCTACHDPHASEAPLLLIKANTVDLCGKCHDWQKHASHPIGEKLKDPRNQNMSLDCLSCHRAHGTEYKHMNPYPTTTELCTKCHQQFKR